ncbi:hypothetical protein [Accumulibacter sp.]|uniref:hypothetical protein n=1 Tax=Accumulibacter sp. TaxID=2053492 RepID=UPI0025E5BE6D|nr:hypothetical protein [Accumulibacter sp.]MCM8614165.1 hypothetical protein [Accumulibacter sp.]MCM8637932.1 hypothetical protein [Accumulibacter sp.]MCM8641401.1 hypothetical protein [Accumulibacter sp.]
MAALLRALGLAWVFASAPAAAGDGPRDLPERAGALLGSMKELGQQYRDLQFRRGGMSAVARAAAADSTAQRLAAYREDLARLSPQIAAGTRFATDLGQFLQKWPDEGAIRQDLLDDGWGERIQTEITSLWLQVPDTRSAWKTPFPLFRP